jgi:hypothetical protein
VPDVSHHRVSRALGVSHDRKCVPDVRHHRVPDVRHDRRFVLGDLPNDEVLHRHVNHAMGVNHGQRFWPDGLRSDEVLRHRVPDVSLGRRCEQVGLQSDEVLHHHVSRAPDVSHASPEQGLSCAQNRLGETCTSHVSRGHRAESCCGVQEVLGSSHGACLHRLPGGHRVSHVSHEPDEHHDRRCAERGLPNVMTVRQLLLRVACVHRGRRLPKHPCGELI